MRGEEEEEVEHKEINLVAAAISRDRHIYIMLHFGSIRSPPDRDFAVLTSVAIRSWWDPLSAIFLVKSR